MAIRFWGRKTKESNDDDTADEPVVSSQATPRLEHPVVDGGEPTVDGSSDGADVDEAVPSGLSWSDISRVDEELVDDVGATEEEDADASGGLLNSALGDHGSARTEFLDDLYAGPTGGEEDEEPGARYGKDMISQSGGSGGASPVQTDAPYGKGEDGEVSGGAPTSGFDPESIPGVGGYLKDATDQAAGSAGGYLRRVEEAGNEAAPVGGGTSNGGGSGSGTGSGGAGSTTTDPGVVDSTYHDPAEGGDGSTTTVYDDGTIVTTWPSGHEKDSEIVHPDGTKETNYSDGTLVTENPDGSKETIHPDGTIENEPAPEQPPPPQGSSEPEPSAEPEPEPEPEGEGEPEPEGEGEPEPEGEGEEDPEVEPEPEPEPEGEGDGASIPREDYVPLEQKLNDPLMHDYLRMRHAGGGGDGATDPVEGDEPVALGGNISQAEIAAERLRMFGQPASEDYGGGAGGPTDNGFWNGDPGATDPTDDQDVASGPQRDDDPLDGLGDGPLEPTADEGEADGGEEEEATSFLPAQDLTLVDAPPDLPDLG